MTSKAITKKQGQQELASREATVSERFLADVERQFEAQMGEGVSFSPLQKRLTQHMFLKMDQALKAAEAKRTKGTEFTWQNVNRQQLALDTVHRVSLELDPLIPNHVHPVFYFNGRTKKYDVNLMTGYVGLDHVVRKFAAEPPLAIRYELVYDTDHFKALPRSSDRDVEGYEFEITSPFDRGNIIGGFGYIEYEEPRKNRLVLVTQRDFERAKASSRGGFWASNDVEMHFKTVVRRVTSRIQLDTQRVNAAALAAAMEDEEDANERAVTTISVDAVQHANQKVLDVPRVERRPEPVTTAEPEPEPEDEPEAAPVTEDEQPEREDVDHLFPEEAGF